MPARALPASVVSVAAALLTCAVLGTVLVSWVDPRSLDAFTRWFAILLDVALTALGWALWLVWRPVRRRERTR